MRAWITDRWTKAATIDGHKVQPPAAQLRKLAILEPQFKAARFGVGKRWKVSWYAVDPETGKKRLHGESFDRKADAEARKAALEDDIRTGRYIDPAASAKTFSEAAEAWYGSKKRPKASTLSRYRRELDIYVLPKWGATRLDAITEDDVNEWVRQLSTGEAVHEFKDDERKPTELAPASVRHIARIVFGGVLKYAVRRRWIAVSPMEHVETPLPQNSDAEMVFLDYGEVESLAIAAEHVAGPTSGTLVRVLAYCGPRINEALDSKVQDVDIDTRRISISRTWSGDGEGGRVESETKGKQRRKTAIPASLIPEIRALVDGQPPDAYLFRAPKGGALSADNWRSRVWVKAVAGAGLDIPGLTIHSLRHSFASLAIAAGADVKTLQGMMGHTSAMVTLDTYAALWPERMDDVAEALDAKRVDALPSCPNHARVGKDEGPQKQTPQ